MPLADDQEEHYLAKPTGCPFCQGEPVAGGWTDELDEVARQFVCADCNAIWETVYVISSVHVIKEPDHEPE